jgi:hypothetical protein
MKDLEILAAASFLVTLVVGFSVGGRRVLCARVSECEGVDAGFAAGVL